MCNDVLLECLMKNPAERARLAADGRAAVERHASKTACARADREMLLAPDTVAPSPA